MIFNTVCRGVRIPKGYAYDHVGEHSPKFVSPLVTITKHGYTKHYFEGMNRICSKLGGGFDAGLLGEIEDTVPALACDYVQQSKRQHEGANRTFSECLGMGAEVDGKYDLYKVVVRETERDCPYCTFISEEYLGQPSEQSKTILPFAGEIPPSIPLEC